MGIRKIIYPYDSPKTKQCSFNIQTIPADESRPYVYGHVRAGYFVHRKRCVTSIINDAETEMYIHMGFSQKSHNPNFVSKLGL